MKVGILGAGQLARMLALAAYPLGIEVVCYESVADTCANKVTRVIQGSYSDENQLRIFAEQVDCVTFETENIPLATAEFIDSIRPCCPSLPALKNSQNRYLEKSLFRQLDIATPRFYAVASEHDLQNALAEVGYPAVLKTRCFGYDGKGQKVLRNVSDLSGAWQELGRHELIVEEFINFSRELSLIAVRNSKGELAFYPLVENQHQEGILRLSRAPFSDLSLQKQAQEYAQRILQHLNYVGVLTIEFFQVGDQLLANEMAPRVHNSGHWTIEGAQTSQFENHLRAICDLPLGDASVRGLSAMFNCIGNMPAMTDILNIPMAHYHDYEKEAKPKRKVGHVTLNAQDEKSFQMSFQELQKIFYVP